MSPADTLAALVDQGAAVHTRKGGLMAIVHAELMPGRLFFIAWPAENQQHAHGVDFDAARVTGDGQYLELWQGDERVAHVAGAVNWPEIETDQFNAGMAAFRAEKAREPYKSAWQDFVAGQRACFAPA